MVSQVLVQQFTLDQWLIYMWLVLGQWSGIGLVIGIGIYGSSEYWVSGKDQWLSIGSLVLGQWSGIGTMVWCNGCVVANM